MILWIVNDNPDTAYIIKNWLNEEFQNDEIEIYNTLSDAKKSGGRPDFLLFDIGMISIVNSYFEAYQVVDDLMDNYGSAIIFLYSAVSCWAKVFVDELREEDYPVIFLPIERRDMIETLKKYGFGKED
jgi:hypothetical protein